MKVGIIGSGLIGRSWSMIFLASGYDVHLFDIKPETVDEAVEWLKSQLTKLEESKVLRGNLTAKEQISKIHKASTLNECVDGAIHVQECVFENLDLKRKVFKDLDEICSETVILASSTSCFLPSLLFDGLKHRSNMLVGHPVNPPYFVPLVEIIPSPWTNKEVVEKTKSLYKNVGQEPVILNKEIEGFIVNRIQYAILNECYRLIENDVISTRDIDKVMAHGLGMRYAFMGPWETAHLNANGMKEYFDKYSDGIYHVSKTFGPEPKMEGKTAEKISKEMTDMIPLEQLEARRKWRDQRLIDLSVIKKHAPK